MGRLSIAIDNQLFRGWSWPLLIEGALAAVILLTLRLALDGDRPRRRIAAESFGIMALGTVLRGWCDHDVSTGLFYLLVLLAPVLALVLPGAIGQEGAVWVATTAGIALFVALWLVAIAAVSASLKGARRPHVMLALASAIAAFALVAAIRVPSG